MSVKHEIQRKVLGFIREHNNDLFSIFKKDESGEIIHEKNEKQDMVKIELNDEISSLLKDYDENLVNEAITEIILRVLEETKKLEKDLNNNW